MVLVRICGTASGADVVSPSDEVSHPNKSESWFCVSLCGASSPGVYSGVPRSRAPRRSEAERLNERLRREERMRKKRVRVIMELLETEGTYQRHLELIIRASIN